MLLYKSFPSFEFSYQSIFISKTTSSSNGLAKVYKLLWLKASIRQLRTFEICYITLSLFLIKTFIHSKYHHILVSALA